MEEADGGSRRGRRRDPEIDQAIIEATVSLFASGGYGRVTIEDIADTAGVSRPTVYRRYASRDEAIHAALHGLKAEIGAQTYSGNIRRDLCDFLLELERVSSERGAMALAGAVLVEEERHPDLIHSFREGIVWPRRKALRNLFEQAASAGVLREGLDFDALSDLIVGGWYAAYTTSEKLSPDWAQRMIDALLPAVTVHWKALAEEEVGQ